jgi:hypothetical protein
LLIYLLLVALAYGPAFFLAGLLEPIYRKLLAEALDAVYAALGGRLAFAAEGSSLVFRSAIPPYFKAGLGADQAYSNLPFLIALLAVTPGMRLSRRAFSLAAGCGMLFLSHVLFLITKVESSLIQAAHPLGNGNRLFWESLDYSFEFLGKGFFPVGIWLLFALGFMTGQVDERQAPEPARQTGRNEPCPCGSGKKYKHCCGRA